MPILIKVWLCTIAINKKNCTETPCQCKVVFFIIHISQLESNDSELKHYKKVKI